MFRISNKLYQKFLLAFGELIWIFLFESLYVKNLNTYSYSMLANSLKANFLCTVQ